ncbi:hypothetical protein KDL01_01880 [Actinospica durhamensis]|uniref:DUF4350 domain-containing protein n=1 Tax=Actinospica durhamensis TaxID=1508375 RepID=A0A941IPI5_9ACTN|nr:DUF4350 domain-containing protein [Actinospica durhamensis]MBR7831988.1 hypothetical protein [Actinospica durhamensis]
MRQHARRSLALVLMSAALALGPAAMAGADSGPLADPTNNDALLNLLMENGVEYDTAQSPDEALGDAGPDSTLVINDDEVGLSAAEVSELATAQWGRVIVLTTDADLLAAFAPGVTLAGSSDDPERSTTTGLQASCDQADAAVAGTILAPDYSTFYAINEPKATATASASPSASPSAQSTASTASAYVSDVTGCYDVASAAGEHEPTMVSLHDDHTGGDVIVLGTTSFAENRYLTDDGDAALALRLFGAHSDLVWLAASFTEDPNLGGCGGSACDGGSQSGGAGSGNQTLLPTAPPQAGGAGALQVNSLLPHWIWWAVLQLVVAAAALAYWRARRMGRLVGEALPVRVRAAETVEGHANLYRRAAAHGRAAGLLRAATARRVAPLLGLPAGPAGRSPQMLVAPLAARLGHSPEEVHAVLAGDVPQTEAELVRLTDQLDRLEQEVRSR